MNWDFAETMILSASAGGFAGQVDWVAKTVEAWMRGPAPSVVQADAATVSADGAVISTDPPYYDNIGYSDLSDFFYVWLRRSLRDVYPELLSTMLVPKAEELVANPYRHDGKEWSPKTSSRTAFGVSSHTLATVRWRIFRSLSTTRSSSLTRETTAPPRPDGRLCSTA